MSLVAARSFFNNIYWCSGDYGNMRFTWGFPIKHVVPVWFHVVPILPRSVRFIVSPGPGAQKPCGSCVVPRGSIGGVTKETAIPLEASRQIMWFLCGSTWFLQRRTNLHCKGFAPVLKMARKLPNPNHPERSCAASCADPDKKTCLCL